MQVVLVMFKGDGERRSFSLAHEITLIGRREDCDLRIPLGDVSRKHCRLIKESDTLRVEDLGSSNGTFINDQRIQESTVHPGDVLRIGPISFIVQINGAPTDEQIVPPSATLSDADDTGVSAALHPAPDPSEEEADAFDPMNTLNAPNDSAIDFVVEDTADPHHDDAGPIVDLDDLQIDVDEEES